MTYTQLSLFPNTTPSQQKKVKLGRYEQIQRELLKSDLHQIMIDINTVEKNTLEYNFIYLFCGAGGLTQGFLQAGFKPIASIEISEIASQTHQKNFPQSRHFCGDIHHFKPKQWLNKLDNPEIHIVVGGPPCQGFS